MTSIDDADEATAPSKVRGLVCLAHDPPAARWCGFSSSWEPKAPTDTSSFGVI